MPATPTDGFVLVDKPGGMTSHDAVAVVRRRLGGMRAGHTGTLDPLATGLLVVLLGAATRLARYVPAEPKVYEATIAFGQETDTDDARGVATRTAPLPDEDDVRAAIGGLTGSFSQVPPAYSAKQVDGQRAYRAARRGADLELRAVPVTVTSWELLEWSEGALSARITCSAGTYVRALARDLGRTCGSAAHLAALRRSTIGPFRVADAVVPGDVTQGRVRPPVEVLVGMPRVLLDGADAELVRHGRPVAGRVEGTVAALLAPGDRLVAVAEQGDGKLQPRVVLADA